jgi:hypothetical protein
MVENGLGACNYPFYARAFLGSDLKFAIFLNAIAYLQV